MNWIKTTSAPDRTDADVTEDAEDSRLHPHTGSITLRACYHFNGSGPQAFGGAKRWPVIVATFAFGEKQEVKRDKAVRILKDAAERILKECQ